MDAAKLKLVTIIAPTELRDRLEADLRALKVSGYTVMAVNGRGRTGPRMHGVFDQGNVRFETLVSPAVAVKLLERVEVEAQTFGVLAFSHDVEAVPRKHFE